MLPDRKKNKKEFGNKILFLLELKVDDRDSELQFVDFKRKSQSHL
jgi:hypothetical protein